jgi:acyl-CoA synthetase (AMP-forming)/AMP-acid ligase II
LPAEAFRTAYRVRRAERHSQGRAFVALRDELNAGEQELRDLIRSRIAGYKPPERIVFLPVLPQK